MPRKSVKDYKIILNFSTVNRSFKDIMESSYLNYVKYIKDKQSIKERN